MLGKGLNFDGDSTQMRLITFSGFIIALFGILNIRFQKRELLICVSLILIALMTVVSGKKYTILMSILAICASKNIDLQKLIRLSFWIRLILMTTVVTLALSGKIENHIMYSYRYGSIWIREGLGIGHPNIAQMTLFIVISMFSYAYYEQFNFYVSVLFLLADWFFYSKTYSRTGGIVTAIFILAVLLSKSERPETRIPKKIMLLFFTYSYVILSTISLLLSVSYQRSAISQTANYYISSRFSAGYYYLSRYPFSLFGNYVDDGLALDNNYIYTYVAFGFFSYIIYIFFSTKLLRRYLQENRYPEILILGAIALYSVSENSFTNITMNFTLLFFKELLFMEKRKGKKKNMGGGEFIAYILLP